MGIKIITPNSKLNKGYFADEAALVAAYPNTIGTPADRNGWYAILGSTDTVWIWDADTNVWVDSGVSGTGDVVGPASATDNALARFDTTTGKLIQDSNVSADDTGEVTAVNRLTLTNANDVLIAGSDATVADAVTTLTNTQIIGSANTAGALQSGDGNVIAGTNAAEKATALTGTTLYGYTAGQYNTAAAGNTFSGYGCGTGVDGSTTGGYNCGYGVNCLNEMTTAEENTATGNSAGKLLTVGDYNCYYGSGCASAFGDKTGSYNSLYGAQSGIRISSAQLLTGMGYQCLYNVTTDSGNANTAFGYQSLYSVSIKNGNTAVGYQSGYTTPEAFGVYLGFKAGYYETAANKLFIDNAERSDEADGRVKSLIYGVFDAATANQLVRMNAEVEVLHNIQVAGQVHQDAITTSTPAGTTQTIDFDTGNMQVVDLGSATGTVTLTLSNMTVGGKYSIKFIQGATERQLTWPASVLWADGAAITLSGGNDDIDLVEGIYDGTNLLASYGTNYS